MTWRPTNEAPFPADERENLVHGPDMLFARLPSWEALRLPF
jgi:hypothetical protein